MSSSPLALAERLGFDPGEAASLWIQALTHISADAVNHYERLEFLGDAVLKLVVSQWLYERHAGLDEGRMSTVRARVVSDAALARVAEVIGLGEFLVLGAGEKRTRGRSKVGILASALEAVMGVIYLTYGYEAVRAFLERWLEDEVSTALRLRGSDNHKAVLQELTQGKSQTLPEYRLVGETGPIHDRTYEIEVWVDGRPCGVGRGKSKKSAEQEAAGVALAAWGAGLTVAEES